MNGGGPGSALWKSVDGGENWTKLGGGLPTGPLGRIAIDIFRKNPNTVYASIEAPSAGRGGGAAGSPGGASGLYRSDDAGQTWRKVSNTNLRPMYFSQVRVDPNDADRVIMGGVKLQ